MKPELDGTGGGYGKFAGKTIEEIRQIYTQCETDPSMRSVSIVLRVAREQLDARGGLGQYPFFAITCAVVLAVTFGIKQYLPPDMQAALPKFQLGLTFITVAFGVGVVKTSQDRKRGLAQERAIVELTLATLDKIVSSPGFQAKPLDFTQDLTMKKLLVGSKENSAAASLLMRQHSTGDSRRSQAD